MNLENVTVEMRPRSEWESADFGVRMIRRDARAIYAVWFAITLPLIALTVLAILFTPYVGIATFLYWWLEPVADGPILRIISRRLFGESADVRASLRATLTVAWRNKIFLLTPLRFHFARSTAMPITQLEGLRGAGRRERAKVLNLRIMNFGTGVTIAYQHLVLALYLGIILIGYLLVPAAYQDSAGAEWMNFFWEQEGPASAVFNLLVFYAAQTALQPWFVGAGFGLYINCRTQLEAWDVEVAFRRMVQRRVAASLLLAVLVIGGLSMSPPAVAQESGEPATSEQTSPGDPGFAGYWTVEDIGPALETAMSDDALSLTEEVTEWQAIDRDDDEEEEEEVSDTEFGSGWFYDFLENVGRTVSFIVEFGLWLALAGFLLLLFMTRDRWLPYLNIGPRPQREQRRVILASGELTAEQLPADIPGEVLRLWQAGEPRRALSLLYRGSVFAAVTQHGVRLPESATEGICVDAVTKQADDAQSAFFRRVVMAWILCAYGFRTPPDETVVPLCEEWTDHYGAAT